MSTLADFPAAFRPLVAVTGDRREVPPQSKGDLLAYSVSSTDVMFMNHLRLGDCLVVSDKQFVVDSEDELERRFRDTHILVVGSPAVNLLARRINDQSVFRFSIAAQTKTDLEEQYRLIDTLAQDEDGLYIYSQCLEGILDIDAILTRYSGLAPNMQSFREKAQRIVSEVKKTRLFRDLQPNQRPIRHLMHKLDKPGIFDSMSKITRGESTTFHKDYGLISFMPNPFSVGTKYHVIYVAGVHGPGTAIGLRVLRDRRELVKHPYGGVYEVFLNRFDSYFERIPKATWKWEIQPYKGSKKLWKDLTPKKKLRAFISSPSGSKDKKQRNFDSSLRERLVAVCAEKGIELSIEDPYTLPMTKPPHSFWDAILNYERKCDFVIHDVTGCAKGVMVEIGFSIGAKIQYFLIWNNGKKHVDNCNDMGMPSLLSVANVEQINLTKSSVNDQLTKKIINPSLANKRRSLCNNCKIIRKNQQESGGFIYSREPQLTGFLEQSLKDRGFRIISENESPQNLRICMICDVLSVTDMAFVHLDERDLDSFIVFGMCQALGKKTLPLTLSGFPFPFPYARNAVRFNLRDVEKSLTPEVPMFLQHADGCGK